MSPALYGLASLVLPGLGQWLLGQRLKAACILLGGSVLCCGGGLVNVVAALDAWGLGKKAVRGESVGPFESARVVEILDAL